MIFFSFNDTILYCILNVCNFAGGDGRWLLTGAHDLVQNNGKKTLFSQNWSDNDAKKYRLRDFYDIFYLHV